MNKEELIEKIQKLERYDLDDDGGCNDPDCCGGANYYINKQTGGSYFLVDEVIKLIKEVDEE